MTVERFVCRFQCDGTEHTFVLPRESHLGRFGDEPYLPTGIWPIDFLCLPHGHVCRVDLQTIRLESVETLGQGLHEAFLWKIEYECARQNCGQRQTIYTRYSAVGAQSDVIRAVLGTRARILCSEGHEARLDAARMSLSLLGS
jgi:hypothetical protein